MFDGVDPVLLARIQFAFTITVHFLFPGFTIGLASFLAVLNGLWLRTRRHLAVFGAGTLYMLRLMAQPPHGGEPGLEDATFAPIRAAGITPAPAIDPHTIPQP